MIDLSAIDPILLLASLMVASTPILLAATGELVTERAGVLNLGVEGMMITGSVVGFIVATGADGLICAEGGALCRLGAATPNLLGFSAAALGGATMALLFAILTQFLLSNQVATGLALTLFGLGIAALLGQGYLGVKSPGLADWPIPVLSDIPWLGRILFHHDPIVYLSLVLVAGVWAVLTYTRAGLILRAVGENHDAAHALGYNVVLVRILAICFGGACAGLGGAYLSLVRVPTYAEGLTAGAGWIALAIVVFASWRPWRLLAGAYLFGGVTMLQLNFQAAGVSLIVLLPWLTGIGALAVAGAWAIRRRPASRTKALGWTAALALFTLLLIAIRAMGWGFDETLWLSASPYLATILVLVVISAGRAPGSLGRPFHASG
ncbi:MAG: simple sugar transport system permease protein [Rhodobacteraceae bacterium HLUCCA08]|nr:MAG: simple sugar transport system permease protein [Rhodobacteraceae bacterium HLUCCA08]